ncbi:uncharacterized protein TM35_000092170 [Trypanosoma theileri]|uniref:Uncharacterized protein n=1 Tax=Trypanosoma theileri TaxID=67003 RepID=A0A1X0NZQ1_9TRYP|nr:uncharacterized protein TM35_000092170 [Trypanosoma theileri]ORC90167.1 hypothetical protein TM35_000092170 [Trypanosoma theileri]
MNSRKWVAQTLSSPTPVRNVTTDDIESTSSMAYKDLLLTRAYDDGNTSETHKGKNIMEGISTKNVREHDRRWQLEKSRWRSARQRSLLQPWHRLEQDFELVSAQLLKGRYPNQCCDVQGHHDDQQNQHHISSLSEAGPTVASMLMVESRQNSIKRQRSQTGTPMEVNSPSQEVNNGENRESSKDDSVLRQSPPPPPPLRPVSFVSPLSLNGKTEHSLDESTPKEEEESMLFQPTGTNGGPMPSDVAGLPPRCVSSVSPEALQSRSINTQKGTVRGKTGYDILSTSDDFRAVSPPLYIITPPNSALSADVTPNPRFERSNENRKEAENEGEQDKKKQKRRFSRERYPVRTGLMTPSVACVLQTPPWKTVEQRSPLPKNRMILTPPRPSIANVSTDFEVVSSVSPVFSVRELVAQKSQESCPPCTPEKENTTGVSSPSRLKDSIIDTWQGLSAYYKRSTGLKTPVVPLLLKKT